MTTNSRVWPDLYEGFCTRLTRLKFVSKLRKFSESLLLKLAAQMLKPPKYFTSASYTSFSKLRLTISGKKMRICPWCSQYLTFKMNLFFLLFHNWTSLHSKDLELFVCSCLDYNEIFTRQPTPPLFYQYKKCDVNLVIQDVKHIMTAESSSNRYGSVIQEILIKAYYIKNIPIA